ncbi:MAG: DUF2764 family protein [Paludibacter sp.]|nr:DUF2764 family protein [Paludibacter sp.]MDD4198297.1 DUF2764 family protein [Paludibacter sp.]MDD4426939.1 DUF2764 family protein [Paludibacter sp.]
MQKIFNQPMNYYCLVAGLPDLQKDDTKGFLSPGDLLAEISPQLSLGDARLFRLLYARYDNANFLSFLRDKEAQLDPFGVLGRTDWEELIRLMQEEDYSRDQRLLPYYIEYFRLSREDEDFLKGISQEDYLAGLYYAYAMQSSNKFVSSWFEFNLNLNNLLTAVFCRKHKINPEKLIVGQNEVAKILRTSHARDYGVGGLFEYTEEVIKLAEEVDLLEREKKIDALKWEWLEEHTFFNYFTIEKVLAYTLRVEMLYRWKMLSFEAGSEIFRNILTSMKQGININA